MIKYIKLRYHINKLNRSRDKIRLDFKNDSKNLSDGEKLNELASSAWFEEKCIDEEISVILTNSLTAKARMLVLPIPEEERYWDECEIIYPNKKILNSKGIDNVRKAIREEHKNTFTYLSYILALIAAVTGLIAVIKG